MIKGIGVIPAWFVRLGLTTSSLILLQSGRHNCLSTCLWEKRPSAQRNFCLDLKKKTPFNWLEVVGNCLSICLGKSHLTRSEVRAVENCVSTYLWKEKPFKLPWETSPDQEQSSRSWNCVSTCLWKKKPSVQRNFCLGLKKKSPFNRLQGFCEASSC